MPRNFYILLMEAGPSYDGLKVIYDPALQQGLRNVNGGGEIPPEVYGESYISAIKSDFTCTDGRNKAEGPAHLRRRLAVL